MQASFDASPFRELENVGILAVHVIHDTLIHACEDPSVRLVPFLQEQRIVERPR